MDNRTKLQTQGLRDTYYYHNFPDGSRATVCFLSSDDTPVPIARGISICSPLDQFNRRLGRAIALGRCFQALAHRTSLLPIHPRSFFYGENQALSINGLGTFKAAYFPEPTDFEKRVMGKEYVVATDPVSA